MLMNMSTHSTPNYSSNGFEKKFTQRTERAKSVDLHPTEPWILASLYSGTVYIWNYQSQVCGFNLPESHFFLLLINY
ncbi:hypothetical protein UlMin_041800 [Ulmus minor]